MKTMKKRTLLSALLLFAFFTLGFKQLNPTVQNIAMQTIENENLFGPLLTALFLTIGMIGVVVEILVPGFGIGATISVVGFGLFFSGSFSGQEINVLAIGLFLIGVVLLIVAMILPGFGVPEVGGVVFTLMGVVLAIGSFETAILSLSIATIITSITSFILIKLGFKNELFSKIILKNDSTTVKGYVSNTNMDIYLGRTGMTTTELRPTGFIEIDNVKLDAIAEANFVERDTEVEVIKVEGSKIFVRRV